MKNFYIGILSILALASSAFTYADTTSNNDPEHLALAPVTWKGDKWEYLVEHPTDVRHIDPVRFEELLDEAGQHGWELVAVTGTAHFYAFYFKRPLLPEKLEKHRQHVLELKKARLVKRKQQLTQIDQAVREQKQYQAQIQKTNQALKQQIREERILDTTTKQEDRDVKQEIRDENRERATIAADDQALEKKISLETKLDQRLKQVTKDEAAVKQNSK